MATSFNNTISNDAGSIFTPESGRYHLYASYGCPFAMRTLVALKLKGLDGIVSVSQVHYKWTSEAGWLFTEEYPDHLYGASNLREVYLKSDPEYKGRVSVPLLWDKKLGKAVNNESHEIVRIFNTAFNGLLPAGEQRDLDLYPQSLRAEIDSISSWTQSDISTGVYAAGWADSQEKYETGARKVFAALDRIESILSKQRFLAGDQITEADVRVLPFILFFDVVFVITLKLNLKTIQHDYPAILRWAQTLYQTSSVGETFQVEYVKKSAFELEKITKVPLIPIGNGPNFASSSLSP
ncbi:glutathione S-transferase [Ramicandelaber brevisporus]|nr:glutathione S-transferase [Ramicandelaber brevisporus]